MDDLRRRGSAAGVIAATRGNHGQSIAFAATRLGLAATLVVPEGNAAGKNAAMSAFGGELVIHGADFETAFEHAQALGAERGLAMVPSFDERLIRGVGTYALELFTAVPDLDAVYVPIGLGSGICGLMGVRDALGLKTEIVGVVAEGANCYAPQLRGEAAGLDQPVHDRGGRRDRDARAFCGGAGADPRRLRARRQRLRRRDAGRIAAYHADTHNMAEGAGASPLAALMQEREMMAGKKVGLILSGGNVDPGVYARAIARLDAGPATRHRP